MGNIPFMPVGMVRYEDGAAWIDPATGVTQRAGLRRRLSALEDITERKRTEEVLKFAASATAGVTGGEFFRALTKSMASALGVPLAVAATYPDSPPTRVRTLAIWTPEGFSDDLDYDLVGTPCALVAAGETCVHREGASALFPNAKPIQLLGADSYIGIPLTGPSGNVNGHLAVLDTKPMADTDQKVAVLEVFAARAGAELHRMRTEAALRLLVEGTASATGDDFFPQLVRTLADALHVKFAFVSELADAEGQRLRLISFWTGTDYGENFEYATRDTPCQEVVGKGLACYPARVQELFPRDAWLREAGIESYLAIPLFDADGKPLGHLGVMHDAPMEESAFAEWILRILAARAGSELERRGTEQALRQSVHKYKSFINQSPDPIFVSRLSDFVFTEVNERACTDYGYTQEEFLTMNIFDIEVEAPVTEQVRRAYDETEVGQVAEVHGTNMRKDGSTFPVHVRFTKLDDEFALAMVRDITERKKAEEALATQEELYRTLVETIPDIIWTTDSEGPAAFLNRAWRDLTGREVEDSLGDGWMESLHPDDAPEVLAKWESAYERGEPYAGECRFKAPDGSYRSFDFVGVPVRDQSGKITQWMGIDRDITERKQAEEALRRYESMVSASSDLMVFVDPTYTYRAANAAYCGAHGTTREEILGHTVVSVLGQKLFETLKPKLDGCLAGERMTFEFWWDSPALGRRHVDVRYDPFYEADGSVSGVLVDIRDDTERQYTQEELGKSRERLRNLAARLQSVREEERTNIAREMHDKLGQALTGVRMDLDWMISRLPKNEKALLERAHSLVSVVDATAEAVRETSWRLRPPILDDLGLPPAIEWYAVEFEKQSGVAVQLDLSVGQLALDTVHATAVFRILQEALTNVARHAEASRVNISLRTSSGQLVMEVRDDGKGITDQDLASTAALGLIGMRERAAPLGGRVTVRRVEEGGTEVKLTLAIGAKEGS